MIMIFLKFDLVEVCYERKNCIIWSWKKIKERNRIIRLVFKRKAKK